ncbi:MAG: AMP-binding protein [Chloroflexi bacterium]|uniref:AMP-binding protein n=1 Tax=Candidatus Chlorohelix allophototropha TaxID=3003348 RepID=A0A8T7M144_9CHLR|nr:AMP-binding protein [Chloroflexota bacterium]WJW67147.1 AMP-binding protein [Chloroflexota bacterium L227-S17]
METNGQKFGKVDYSPLKHLSLWEVFEQQAKKHPEAEALVFNHTRLSYRQVCEKAQHLSTGLHAHGLGKGDKLALILPNWLEFVITYLATARLGAIIVPLNVRYRSSEIEYMLRNSGTKIVVTCAEFGDFDFAHLLKELKPQLPALQLTVVVGQPEGGHGLVSWETVLGEGAKVALSAPALIEPSEDLLAIMYTSGTTGIPKGAMLTHRNVVENALTVAEMLEVISSDRFLGCVPFFHIFGLGPTIVTALGCGASVILMDIYKPEEALLLVETEQITVKHGVPTMFILELNNPNFSRFNLSSLRTGIIAAAPAPAEIIRRIRTEMSCEILSAYGLTETSPCLTITRANDCNEVREETVGRTLPGMEIRILDDEENKVPIGAVGELVCRTPGLMKGYYNMPEATANAVDRDGWFYTGDLATLDEAGNVRIVGRKKEMINRGGLKIYPREVEELYYKNQKVQEIAIVGLPDPVLGEISCACIKLREGVQADVDEMRQYIKEKVADYKIPDRIRFVESFPMTSSGKIRKVQLREELIKING